MVTMGMELSQRADGHPLDADARTPEGGRIMPVKIGDKYYCFARCGCKTNKDIIIEALLEGAKKFSDPHVKAHNPQEYVDMVAVREAAERALEGNNESTV